MSKSLIFILCLVNFYSCAKFIREIEKKDQHILPKTVSCPYQKNLHILSNSNVLTNALYDFYKAQNITNHYDMLIYSGLLHMRFFPHKVGPESSVLYIESEKKVQIENYSLHQHKYPYIKFLLNLARKRNKKIEIYISSIDKHFKVTPKVDPSLESFIIVNKKQILKNPYLAKFYLKGQDGLQSGESLKKIDLVNIFKLKNIKKISGNNVSHLFKSANQVTCNFDQMLYEKSLYPIRESSLLSVNTAIIKNKRKVYLMNIYQETKNKLETIGSSPFLKLKKNNNLPAFCFNKHRDFILSYKDRDPAQYIHHLLELGIFNENDNIGSFLEFPRHLFLNSPTRILFESNFASEKQISQMQQHRMPIYHVQELGSLLIHSNSNKAMYLDGRSTNNETCL